jgi:hypothetical protein
MKEGSALQKLFNPVLHNAWRWVRADTRFSQQLHGRKGPPANVDNGFAYMV